MNMQKALQHLYKAVSGQDTSKVNISKLLVDIHKALTGKDSANRNNWARIIDSMAENWSGGGGGSSDFSTAEVVINGMAEIYGAFLKENGTYYTNNAETLTVILYKGKATLGTVNEPESVTGNITYDSDREEITVTGDGTITFGGLL